MQRGAPDAVNLRTADGAGTENDSAAALVETRGRVLDFSLRFAFYTIAFHVNFYLHFS